MKKNNWSSYICGWIVFIMICISSIYTVLKTGNNVVIDTALLSLMVFWLLRCKERKILYADVFARASLSAMTSIASYMVAIKILKIDISVYDYCTIILLFVASAVAGVEFFDAISASYFNLESYSFPQQEPRIRLLAELCNTKNGKKNPTIKSFFATCVVSQCFKGIGIYARNFNLCNIVTITPSLLTSAVGYFIGWKTYLIMIFGAVYSFIIYIVEDSVNYTMHIQNPYIYSVIVGFSLVQGVVVVFEFFKICKGRLKGTISETNMIKRGILVLGIYIAVCCLIASLSKSSMFSMPFGLPILIIPFSITLSVSTMKSIAETGYWISVLDDLLPIIMMIIFSGINLETIIVLVSALTMFEMCGIYYVINKYVGKRFNVASIEIKKVSLISVVICTITGVLIIKTLINTNGLMTDNLPAPLANAFAAQLKTIYCGIVNNVFPDNINVIVIICAFLCGLLMTKINISPMIILAGLMLPFGTMILMGIGVVISIFAKQKEYISKMMSGVALGESLVLSVNTIIESYWS